MFGLKAHSVLAIRRRKSFGVGRRPLEKIESDSRSREGSAIGGEESGMRFVDAWGAEGEYHAGRESTRCYQGRPLIFAIAELAEKAEKKTGARLQLPRSSRCFSPLMPNGDSPALERGGAPDGAGLLSPTSGASAPARPEDKCEKCLRGCLDSPSTRFWVGVIFAFLVVFLYNGAELRKWDGNDPAVPARFAILLVAGVCGYFHAKAQGRAKRTFTGICVACSTHCCLELASLPAPDKRDWWSWTSLVLSTLLAGYWVYDSRRSSDKDDEGGSERGGRRNDDPERGDGPFDDPQASR